MLMSSRSGSLSLEIRNPHQFMFPREDARGPQDGAWLAEAIERAQAQLASLRFDRP